MPQISNYRQHFQLKREYKKWHSPTLNRDMELLVFGDRGAPVILFPTRMARFYDYEDWGVIAAIADKIDAGQIQVFCLDSIDGESFYCKSISPAERIKKYGLFETYLLDELIPFIQKINHHPHFIAAGCSLGAYHAVNFAFRHPKFFSKLLAMSGRYDLTIRLPYFEDLFEGYWDESIYYNMPCQYIRNLDRDDILHELRRMTIRLVIGREDAFYENNKQLSSSLHQRNIPHILHVLDGEAHKAKYWGEMMRLYL